MNREQLINYGIIKLQSFGFHSVDKHNLLTDLNYGSLFKSLLSDQSIKIYSYSTVLINEINNNIFIN